MKKALMAAKKIAPPPLFGQFFRLSIISRFTTAAGARIIRLTPPNKN